MSSIPPPPPAARTGLSHLSPNEQLKRKSLTDHPDTIPTYDDNVQNQHPQNLDVTVPAKARSSTWSSPAHQAAKPDIPPASSSKSPIPAVTSTIHAPKKTISTQNSIPAIAPVSPPTPTLAVEPPSHSPVRDTHGADTLGSSSANSVRSPKIDDNTKSSANIQRRPKSTSTSTVIRQPTAPLASSVSKSQSATDPDENKDTSFFSSVLSAAGGALKFSPFPLYPKPKLDTPSDSNVGHAGGEEVIMTPDQANRAESVKGAGDRPAIDTLGKGNLSLLDLGIPPEDVVSNKASSLHSSLDEQRVYVEGNPGSHAIAAAYNSDSGASNMRSRASTNAHASGSAAPDGTLSGPSDPKRLERGSSLRRPTSVANSDVHSSTFSATPLQKQSTFAFAPTMRNRAFHETFRSIPKDDRLIEDYSAALQREILLQGRLYISQGHICFFSNIIGWTTSVVISFDEIISVRKKWTAKIFPNGLIIETLHARNVFASLLSRDTTFELIARIWRTTHPNLKQVENGFELNNDPLPDLGLGDDESGGDDSYSGSDSDSFEDDDVEDDEVYDEDADLILDRDVPSASGAGQSQGSAAQGRSATAPDLSASGPFNNSGTNYGDGAGAGKGSGAGGDGVVTSAGAAGTSDANPSAQGSDGLGPTTHAPTSCGDSDKHFEKELMDTTIAAPLGKVYSLMFGPASGQFMKNWLSVDQKCLDVQLENDGRGLDSTKKDMSYSYIKPLYATIGPKQTKCIINCHLEQFDLNKAVSVLCITTNPDVPSGKVFSVRTRYCLMWGPNNSTRLLANYIVEWTGSSFIKGPIERNAHDGQVQYIKDLVAALSSASSGRAGQALDRKNRKSRRRNAAARERKSSPGGQPDHLRAHRPGPDTSQRSSNPIFELLRPYLGNAVVGFLGTVFSTQGFLAALSFVVLLMYLKQRRLEAVVQSTHDMLASHSYLLDQSDSGAGAFKFADPISAASLSPRSKAQSVPGLKGHTTFEDLWSREQRELWEWLDQRVGSHSHEPLGSDKAPIAGRDAHANERDGNEVGSHGTHIDKSTKRAPPEVSGGSDRSEDVSDDVLERVKFAIGDQKVADAIRAARAKLDALERKLEREKETRKLAPVEREKETQKPAQVQHLPSPLATVPVVGVVQAPILDSTASSASSLAARIVEKPKAGKDEE